MPNHIVLSVSACGDIDGGLKCWSWQIAGLSRRVAADLSVALPMILSTAMFQGDMAEYHVHAGQPTRGAWCGPLVTP
jgi:hypothetical protein